MTLFISVLAASLTVGLMVFFGSEPRYTARTDVVVLAVSDLAGEASRPADVSIDSAVQVLLSDRVLGETARSLSYPGRSSGLLEDMTISPIINSRILRIYVSALQPDEAHNAVNALAERFLEARRSSLLAADNVRARSIQAQIDSVDLSLEQLSNNVLLTDENATESTAELATERVDLETELTALSVNELEPGYISHIDAVPTKSNRAGLPVYTASSAALGLVIAVFLDAVLRRWSPIGRRAHRSEWNPPRKSVPPQTPTLRQMG
ncbi:hypothetical protein [Arthrobacter sp. H20]|uniref:hypothetical protein n=1 Tax=Arthrobacter sp. H20 TaxID=1267981 RepID=UPI00138B13D6|nr:hypothetical protein [Arthrobacter sp. H20]